MTNNYLVLRIHGSPSVKMLSVFMDIPYLTRLGSGVTWVCKGSTLYLLSVTHGTDHTTQLLVFCHVSNRRGSSVLSLLAGGIEQIIKLFAPFAW